MFWCVVNSLVTNIYIHGVFENSVCEVRPLNFGMLSTWD